MRHNDLSRQTSAHSWSRSCRQVASSRQRFASRGFWDTHYINNLLIKVLTSNMIFFKKLKLPTKAIALIPQGLFVRKEAEIHYYLKLTTTVKNSESIMQQSIYLKIKFNSVVDILEGASVSRRPEGGLQPPHFRHQQAVGSLPHKACVRHYCQLL